MTDQSLRTQVVELAKLHADAMAQGNTKKSNECSNRIQAKQLHHIPIANSYFPEVNYMLKCFNATFDPEMIVNATAIEGWGTNFSCPDEFTLFVLRGPDGYMAHRIIKGY